MNRLEQEEHGRLAERRLASLADRRKPHTAHGFPHAIALPQSEFGPTGLTRLAFVCAKAHGTLDGRIWCAS